MNVLLVILLFLATLAILGMNIMAKKMGFCASPDPYFDFYGVSKAACLAEGLSWEVYPWNMDDFATSMLTIFVFASLEGWNDLVYTFLDANPDTSGPVFENRLWMLTYNLSVIYLCAFFCVNLFVGVIFLNFSLAEQKARDTFLSDNQYKFINICKMVVKTESDFSSMQLSNNPLSIRLRAIMKYKGIYDKAMMGLILTNILILCLNSDANSLESAQIQA